jgi:hypothetical protein
MRIQEKKTLSFNSVGKLLSVFILVIGLTMCGSGVLMFSVGKMGAGRYEKTSGKLMRMLSDKDQHTYGYLHFVISLGYLMQAGGLIIGAAGIYTMKNPDTLARYFFK